VRRAKSKGTQNEEAAAGSDAQEEERAGKPLTAHEFVLDFTCLSYHLASPKVWMSRPVVDDIASASSYSVTIASVSYSVTRWQVLLMEFGADRLHNVL
jgi:hypothetical protein